MADSEQYEQKLGQFVFFPLLYDIERTMSLGDKEM